MVNYKLAYQDVYTLILRTLNVTIYVKLPQAVITNAINWIA